MVYVTNGTVSVCSSVCLSHLSIASSVRYVCCWAPRGQAISLDCCTAHMQQAPSSNCAAAARRTAARRSAANASSVTFTAAVFFSVSPRTTVAFSSRAVYARLRGFRPVCVSRRRVHRGTSEALSPASTPCAHGFLPRRSHIWRLNDQMLR